MLKPKKKITKKQIKRDKLLEVLFKIEVFTKSNIKTLTYAGGALLLILVLSFFFLKSKRTAEIKSASVLGLAQFSYINRDYDDVIVRLSEAVEKYSGTKSAAVGAFYLASSYYEKGEYERAEKYFRKYIDNNTGDEILLSSSYAGIAACYENKSEYLKAAQMYEKAAEKASHKFLRLQYLYSAARNYMMIENYSRAKELYNEIYRSDPKYSLKSKVEADIAKINTIETKYRFEEVKK